MSETFRAVCLACHGETAWTVTGQHTGRTDLALTEPGERNTQRLGERLGGLRAKVFTSPSRRAIRKCELASFGSVAQIDGDLVEWDYGTYEGRLTVDILNEPPDWQLFRDGCPGGESPRQVAARVDRVVSRARTVTGDVLVFPAGIFSECWPHDRSARPIMCSRRTGRKPPTSMRAEPVCERPPLEQEAQEVGDKREHNHGV